MLSHVWFFVTPWTVAHQAPLSMEYSRQEYWSGLPFPSPGDLPHPGIKHQKKNLLHCRQILYHLSHQGSPIANIEVSLKEWKKNCFFFFLWPFHHFILPICAKCIFLNNPLSPWNSAENCVVVFCFLCMNVNIIKPRLEAPEIWPLPTF